ncbi:MAG: DUF928 domain-containing protein [Cyanobacteria bacterium J06629_19]
MIIKKFTHAATLVGMSSVLCLGALSSAVLAETAEITSAKSNQSGETLRQGLPGRRLGGGTRQGGQVFTAEYAYLAALTTSDNLNITTAQRPTLMFYIPDMTAEYTAELIIRDAQDNMVYEGLFQLGSEEGIVSFNTAEQENMPALALNETYQWYFSIIPEVTDRASDIVVNGNIRRVEKDAWLSQQSVDTTEITALEETNPLMQARMLYQQANLWHEAAVILNELRQANPSDDAIAAEWEQLIEFAGLTAVVPARPAVHIGSN